VAWPCGVALESRAFRYRTVRRLAEQAETNAPKPRLVLTHEHELIRPLDQYALLASTNGGTR